MPSSKRKFVFVLKLLLGMVPLIVFYCFARFCGDDFMQYEWPTFKYVKEYMNNHNQYNDFLILGDSVAKYNINASELSSADCLVQNLALGGTSNIELYFTLKTYLENGNGAKIIILAFAPFHYEKLDCFTYLTEYFHIYSMQNMIDLYKTAFAFKDDEDVQLHFFRDKPPITKLLKAAVFYPPKYLPAMINSRVVLRIKWNVEQINNVKKNNGTWLFGTEINPKPVVFANRVHFKPQEIQVHYLKLFLELCKEKNIHVIIEQSPFAEVSKGGITESFEREYFAFLNSFKEAFPEIEVVSNFSYYDDNFFCDGHHMNNNGNAAWTQYIKEKYIEPYIKNEKTLLEEEK